MHNSSTYRVGPRGGVYTVDFDGTRHYLDREQARRYIAELTAKRSSAGTATKSRTSEASDAPGNPNPSYWWLNAAGLGAFFLVILPLILRF